MAEPLILKRNLSEPNLPLSLVLRGVPIDETTPSVLGEVYWRFEDEPDMKPAPLAKVVAGRELAVPFDLKGRDIRLFVNSKTEDGTPSASAMERTEQIIFAVPTIPSLVDAVFDSGTDDVTLTIAPHGGGGAIRVLRQIGSEGFFEIASVAADATEYVDSPAIDGTYQYKLTQDGLVGDSNVKTVEVDVGDTGTGAAPSDLSTFYEAPATVDLSWTNNGGTGLNIIERANSFGGIYSMRGSVAAGVNSFSDFVLQSRYGRTYFYRVRNESFAGYSNVADVYVEGDYEEPI